MVHWEEIDLYWNLTELKYNNEEVDIKMFTQQKYDPDRPGYGMSIYNLSFMMLSDKLVKGTICSLRMEQYQI